MRRALILAFFLVLSSPLAHAEDKKDTPTPPPVLPVLAGQDDARPLVQTRISQVTKAIDHKTVMIADQSVVELSGIDVPEPLRPEARAFLAELLESPAREDVLLYQTPSAEKGRVNRMTHALAHLVRKDGEIWVQGALIANGFARAMPTVANPELAARMYAIENAAIAKKAGLWADDTQSRLYAATDDLSPLGRVIVVEGVVQKISMLSNTTYLNFGEDWRKDFTIGIPTPVRQQIARQNIDLFQLQGKKIRVRGWVREYNGPYIELEDAVLLQRPEDIDAKEP